MSVERYLSDTIGHQASTKRAPDVDGIWENRLGSQMQLSVDPGTRVVTGSYRTAVGKPGPNEEFDLRGFVSCDLLVFCVNFGKYASLTAWVGQHTKDDNGNEVIYTLWHLAKNVPDKDEPEDLWAGILAGSNEYRRPPRS